MKLFNIKLDKQKFKFINPISHIKTLNYLNSSEVIFTDSGGVQRESYFLKKKTVILRNDVEWLNLIKNGRQKIWDSKLDYSKYKKNLLGNGKASSKIINIVKKLIK